MRYGIALSAALLTGAASAGEPRVLEPTRLTYQIDNPISMEAILRREAGIEFPSAKRGTNAVNASEAKGTLWETIGALENSRKGYLEIPAEGLAWKLLPQAGSKLPVVATGAFRLEIREVRAVQQFREANRRTDVVMQLAWEPRYPVCRVDAQPRLSKLTDNLGNAYPLIERPRRIGARGNFAPLTLPIINVPRPAADLAVIEGKILVTACPAMKTAEFANLGERTKFADADAEVQLLAFQKEGKYWSADIAVKYLAKDMASFESFERERIGLHRAVLVSPTGLEHVPAGFEEADDRFAFRFEDSPNKPLKMGDLKGWRLKYRYPGAWVEVEVPFKFQRVSLP